MVHNRSPKNGSFCNTIITMLSSQQASHDYFMATNDHVLLFMHLYIDRESQGNKQ